MALINFSGIASGIDTASLIDAIIEQKRAGRVEPLQRSQDRDRETNDALNELKGLLDELKQSADSFRVVNGGGLDTIISSSDEQVAIASTFGNTSEGSYDITVNQLARNGALSFDDRFSAFDSLVAPSINDGAPAADRTLSFTVGTGGSQETIDIEVTSSTKATDILESFNSQSSLATASLINVGSQASPSYAFNITSKSSGSEKGTLSVSSGSELAGAGVLSATSLSQASDASFSVSGISGTITRSSNTVSDLIPGVSVDLEGLGTTTLTVNESADDTTTRVRDLVEKFNAVVSFIQENDLVTQEQNGQETINTFGSLTNSTVDENVLSTLRSDLSSASENGLILADLGITSARDGTLEFDEAKFQSALTSDSSSVAGLLESIGESLGGTNGKIAQFSRFQGVIDQAVSASEELIREREQRIADIEASLSSEEGRLQGRFARLESLIGRLNQQSSALVGLIPSG